MEVYISRTYLALFLGGKGSRIGGRSPFSRRYLIRVLIPLWFRGFVAILTRLSISILWICSYPTLLTVKRNLLFRNRRTPPPFLMAFIVTHLFAFKRFMILDVS